VTTLLAGRSEVQIPAGATDVSLLQNARTTGANPACYSLPTVGVFPGLSGRGVELTPRFPSSARAKNEWNYTSAPLYILMSWTGTTSLFGFLFANEFHGVKVNRYRGCQKCVCNCRICGVPCNVDKCCSQSVRTRVCRFRHQL
jgi:hypothetical protein